MYMPVGCVSWSCNCYIESVASMRLWLATLDLELLWLSADWLVTMHIADISPSITGGEDGEEEEEEDEDDSEEEDEEDNDEIDTEDSDEDDNEEEEEDDE